jgi:hypothetical protein
MLMETPLMPIRMMPGTTSSVCQPRPESVEQRDQRIDQKVVGEDDQMAPDGLISVDAARRLQLLNDGPVCDEHIAAVEHELGDELQAMKPKVTKGRKLAVPPPTRGL